MNLREWALPVYTILIQLATGGLLILWSMRAFGRKIITRDEFDDVAKIPLLIIFSTIFLAMVGAHFHLSRPYLSFLAMVNVQTSWLSREIVTTVLLFLMTGILLILVWFVDRHVWVKEVLGWGAVLSGLVTIFSMARIYMLPTQMAWNSPLTVVSYYLSTFLLGTSSMAAILPMEYNFAVVRGSILINKRHILVKKSLGWITATAVLMAILIILIYLDQIETLFDIDHESVQASIQLLLGLYRPLLLMRMVLLLGGAFGLIASVWYFFVRNKPIKELIGYAYVFCTLVVVSEILGRFLFYATHVRVGL